MKPVTLKASEGRLLLVCRAGKGSPDLQVRAVPCGMSEDSQPSAPPGALSCPPAQILAGNSQQLDYVLNRSGQTQDYGPDRCRTPSGCAAAHSPWQGA